MFAISIIVPRGADSHLWPIRCGPEQAEANSMFGPRIELQCGFARIDRLAHRHLTPRMRSLHTGGALQLSTPRLNGNCKEIDDQGPGQEGGSR